MHLEKPAGKQNKTTTKNPQQNKKRPENSKPHPGPSTDKESDPWLSHQEYTEQSYLILTILKHMASY